jgi:hypothetical protein
MSLKEIARIVVWGGSAQQIILRYVPSVCAVRNLSTPASPRVPWLNAARNLAPARALPISAIRVAVRETDVTESRSTHSLLWTNYARDFPENVVNNRDGERSEFRIIEIR